MMEPEKLKGKEHETQLCIEKDQTSKSRKKMPMEKKKKVVSEKPKTPKSKAKQVTSNTTKNSRSTKRKRIGMSDIYDDVESMFTVMEQAARVLGSMEDEVPYFLKSMLPSNVTYSFWLIIPRKFGSLHLPRQDSTVILVDEWGKEYKTTYLIDRNGLSAGWRGFSISHRLLKGDILIFRLIGPCKLQVHIVRVHGLDVVNAALCLMNMDAFGKTTESDLAEQDNRKRKRRKKYADYSLLDAPKIQHFLKKGQMLLKSDLVPADQSENTSDGFASDVLEGPEMADHLLSGDHHCTEASILHERPCEGVTCG